MAASPLLLIPRSYLGVGIVQLDGHEGVVSGRVGQEGRSLIGCKQETKSNINYYCYNDVTLAV